MKTLYIIHGWTYTTEPWQTTIDTLKAKGVTCKMLNVPGLTAPSRKIWTIEEYVDWADKNLPDGAVALGHSNGGRILMNLLSQKPDKLTHLILLDSAGVHEKSFRRDFLKKLAKIGSPLKKNRYLSKIFHKLIGANDYDRAPANMKQTLTNMLESDKKLDPSTITTATTILWGKNDTITPPRQAQILHNKIKNSKLRIHRDWTHAPYISHPKKLAQEILAIMEKI